jgi:Mg2+ and Co2+ transporter CorA
MVEAISAVASVIGVVTAAVQSTKYSYQMIEGIKDAPSMIRKLGDKIKNLEDALVQLKCIQSPSPRLKPKVEECQRDLKEFSRKVEKKISDLEGKSRSRKIRKSFQVWFSDEEYKSMNENLDDYVQFFSFQILLNINTEIVEKYLIRIPA